MKGFVEQAIKSQKKFNICVLTVGDNIHLLLQFLIVNFVHTIFIHGPK